VTLSSTFASMMLPGSTRAIGFGTTRPPRCSATANHFPGSRPRPPAGTRPAVAGSTVRAARMVKPVARRSCRPKPILRRSRCFQRVQASRSTLGMLFAMATSAQLACRPRYPGHGIRATSRQLHAPTDARRRVMVDVRHRAARLNRALGIVARLAVLTLVLGLTSAKPMSA